MNHFAFTKVVVDDLETCAAFYTQTFGLEEQYRVRAAIAGRPIDEILYAASAPGGGTFILLRFTDGPGAPTGVILGFVTDEIDAVFTRAVGAGGSVAQEPTDMPEHGHRVGFLADPEGRLIEVVQALVAS
ncbi:MAG: VOC family protein [Actinomycetota bacterium]